MSIPLAVVGAVVLALLETSVLPELTIAGVKPDLVFIFAVTSTMMIGIEVGLTWAFVGGLMLDFLTPGRQLGVTSLALLLIAGAVIIASGIVPQRRILVAAATVFVMAWGFQVLQAALLNATTGVEPSFAAPAILTSAVVDGLLALPVAAAFKVLWQRFGAQERLDW